MQSPTLSESDTVLEFASQQIRMLLTHPYFTGQCPECHALFSLQDSIPRRCWCVECGWNDLPD
jgi:hypothetical protein